MRDQDGIDDPYTDCHLLMAYSLGKSRAWLLAHDDELLGEPQLSSFRQLIDARQRGEPIAHLTGTREFWSLAFKVTPDTLIPRPETEHLVEQSLALALPASGVGVLDYGTGSGVVAIALATERPDWGLSAIDCSANALQIARENAAVHNANIDFVEACDLEGFATNSFDLIVSNPPYIEEHDPHLQQGDVRFEPRMALVSGSDGLDCIRYLIENSPAALKPSGYLAMEHG